jgi:hypothetical protein
MNRLQQSEPRLWEKLQIATSDARWAAVLHACEYAVRVSGIEDLAIMQSFELLVMRQEFSDEDRDWLRGVADSLDEQYFQTREADPEQSAVYFSQARAASCVYWASQPESDTNAAEAIYEALNVPEELDELLSIINQALDRLEMNLR